MDLEIKQKRTHTDDNKELMEELETTENDLLILESKRKSLIENQIFYMELNKKNKMGEKKNKLVQMLNEMLEKIVLQEIKPLRYLVIEMELTNQMKLENLNAIKMENNLTEIEINLTKVECDINILKYQIESIKRTLSNEPKKKKQKVEQECD